MTDDCFPACQVPRVRWVCKLNGAPTTHAKGVCPDAGPHVREELAPAGARPRCLTHDLDLVRA